MCRRAILLVVLVVLAGSIGRAEAHVSILYPTGEEQFLPGQTVRIEWRLDIPHNQVDWDVYVSYDGEASWEVVVLDLPISTLSFDWVVPSRASSMAHIRVVQNNVAGDYEAVTPAFSIETVATGVERREEAPTVPTALSVYPNPSRGRATVSFLTGRDGHARAEVFDVQGRRVAVLLNGIISSGRHAMAWEADARPPGIYLVRLSTAEGTVVRPLVLMD